LGRREARVVRHRRRGPAERRLCGCRLVPCHTVRFSVPANASRGSIAVRMKSGLVALALLAAPLAGRAADQVTVTAAHALSIARPAETIAVPWRDLAAALPGVLLQHLQVTDAAGRVLP